MSADAERPVEKHALTAQDAAVALSIPYRSLMAAIAANQIGAVKIGRYYQVPVAEIDRLLSPAIKVSKTIADSAREEVSAARKRIAALLEEEEVLAQHHERLSKLHRETAQQLERHLNRAWQPASVSPHAA